MPESPASVALAYHLRTRHAPHAYARALPYMDWDTQPDPFRRYAGAPVVLLDRATTGPEPRYDDVLDGVLPAAAALDWGAISRLFFHSLALSAWKEAGDARWSLRVNPSSGNLHPTEAYLVCGAVADLCDAPGVFHYNALLHGLERRAVVPLELWRRLAADLPAGSVIVGLSTIAVRESWKYGERAFRYCQHDTGHAIAAVAIAAAGLGWRARVLDGVPDASIAEWLGFRGQTGPEAELAECLVALSPAGAPVPIAQWRYLRLPPVPGLGWEGKPAALATDHHDWPIIEVVTDATRRVSAPPEWVDAPARAPAAPRPIALHPLLRQRRSAVDMDGKASMSREAFLRTMRRLLPGAPPFSTLPWPASVHPFLFVHRVRDLEPGLYALLRGGVGPDSFGVDGAWDPVEPELPLYRVRTGDVRALAASVSCGQAIASDGVFAMGMLCDLAGGMARDSAAFYRRAHWEAGAIGQVLYLEAESDGLRGTGIGCFFDEEMARAVRLPAGSDWRTVYHFTVGGPVEDDRLRTLDAYAHLGPA